MQQIVFRPMTEMVSKFIPSPKPSKLSIPKWYKDMPLFVNNEKELGMHPKFEAGTSNVTLKSCVPFLDAMTSGYMITLGCDIEIKNISKNDISIRWIQKLLTMVEGHNNDQIPGFPFKNNEFEYVSKWLFDWKIETPSGYSCMYTHPLNRTDLPFRTFSGVVDTDVFPDAVHFPFIIMPFEGERLIVPAGTPICQVIPFKRDTWTSEIQEYVPGEKEESAWEIVKHIGKAYKNKYWHKKSYS